MERPLLKAAAIVVAAWLMAGCSGYGSMLDVARGNLAFGRGDYQVALVRYMGATNEDRDAAWIQFNVANVYYALGEHEAALEFWDSARSTAQSSETGSGTGGEASLLFASTFNRGVLLFQQGNYRAASDEFVYALSINPRNADAKTNLELALAKLRASEAASNAEGSSTSVDLASDEQGDGADEQTLRLLEYVRRKETQQWFANRELDTGEESRDW